MARRLIMLAAFSLLLSFTACSKGNLDDRKMSANSAASGPYSPSVGDQRQFSISSATWQNNTAEPDYGTPTVMSEVVNFVYDPTQTNGCLAHVTDTMSGASTVNSFRGVALIRGSMKQYPIQYD